MSAVLLPERKEKKKTWGQTADINVLKKGQSGVCAGRRREEQ